MGERQAGGIVEGGWCAMIQRQVVEGVRELPMHLSWQGKDGTKGRVQDRGDLRSRREADGLADGFVKRTT